MGWGGIGWYGMVGYGIVRYEVRQWKRDNFLFSNSNTEYLFDRVDGALSPAFLPHLLHGRPRGKNGSDCT